MTKDARDSEGFPVKVDFRRILQTIAASIYDNQYAFLRENVQNAIDAIRIQALRDKLSTNNPRYRVDVTIRGKTCSISDNGIGMTKDELANNFWTMGASGKTTEEARKAGCIGVFGIGGFANFGVCETLEVISRTAKCLVSHHTSLSTVDFETDQFALPEVRYDETAELSSRGTIVRGTAADPFDEDGLVKYLKQFVRFVPEQVFVQNELVSQEEIDEPQGTYRELTEIVNWKQDAVQVRFQLFADAGHNLSARIHGLRIGEQRYKCKGYVRLVNGQLDVYKRGFRLCAVTVSSRIGITGSFDADILQPTAGRDTLDTRSQHLLNQIFGIIEAAAKPIILQNSDLLLNHIRLIPDFISAGSLDKLGLLRVSTLGNETITLEELRKLSKSGKRVFFTHSGRATSAAEVLQTRGHVIVKISDNYQRRSAEVKYIQTYCNGEQFDNLIELLEEYENLDAFEKAVLSELDYAIKKLFSPKAYKFIAGKLTLDAPIYWSDKKEDNKALVFVDTRHGEFLKLKPLGFTGLFWSMIEAFCREYLGGTLKTQSTKFFGSGAVDLDAYSKSHAELWELLSTDIEVSRIAAPGTSVTYGRSYGRIEVVHTRDITQVTISPTTSGTADQSDGEVSEEQATGTEPAKLLRIVDDTGVTGLQGYYLRIPETATTAFGDLIRTFDSFAVVWFANRVTWQGTDLKSTAFLFDVTLDRLIGDKSTGAPAHGAAELPSSRIQSYNNQIYFYIPPEVQDHIIPSNDVESVKIEIQHELLDLGKARSWTSKESKETK
jgi:molecular chaperone HtpG